jgi:hypothetical protein
MEWGFALAILGLVIILVSTIWYFAGQGNELRRMLNNTTGIIGSTNLPVIHQQPGCTPSTTPAVGTNISLSEAVSNLTTPTGAVIGWVVGALAVVGGVSWGLISRGRAKPDSTLASLLPAALLAQAAAPVTPVVVAPTAPAKSQDELAALIRQYLTQQRLSTPVSV